MTDAEVDARIRWLEETFYKAWPSSVPLVPVPQAPASFRTKERFEKLEKAGESVGICPCLPYLELIKRNLPFLTFGAKTLLNSSIIK